MMIVPSILTDSLDVIQKDIGILHDRTSLRRVQIDVVDPDFADEITVTPIDILQLDLQGFAVDIHLMTNEPINDVVECSQIKGITTIIAQIEHMSSQKAYVDHVKSYEIGAGLSIDLYTPLEAIEDDLFESIDILQIMGNKAGKQKQPFAGESVLQKIDLATKMRDKKNVHFLIAVDIGMTPENAKLCQSHGADMVTPGSFLWQSENIQTAIEAYTETR